MDYETKLLNFTLNGEQSSHTVSINIIDDEVVEDLEMEMFYGQLTLLSSLLQPEQFMLAPDTTTVSIIDNDGECQMANICKLVV